jgi:type II secretory pathway pseudopilin PulG
MPTRARQTKAEEGFILIEVLVSALILAIVAGAVLTLITATTRSAASERNHSTAYGLAQEDQARLRTMRISSLNHLEKTREEKIGGTTFFVESKGVFVNNKSGTASCTEQNSSADYVEITSTVSSPTLLHPVTLQSVVSPSSGSLDPSHGTLSFQVNNARGEAVSGVSLISSGSTNPGSFSGSSEASGCAIFADLPAGNYKVTATANGLITPEGSSTWTKEQVGVPASGTQQVLIHFDKAGTIAPSFVYKDPATGSLLPAPVDSMELFDSENEAKTITFGTPTTVPRSSKLEDKVVYPFKTAYAVYAGSCTSNNPDPEGKKINEAAIASVAVAPGGVSTPTVQVPALNLSITNSSGKAVKGAKVLLTDTACKYNSTNVKREFTTNKAGHIVNSGTELETETQAVGLPFGTYDICVSATLNGTEPRRAEASGVTVNNLGTAVTTALVFGTNNLSECK